MQLIKGFDVSSLEEVERHGGIFYRGGMPCDAFEILQEFGANWIRLRLWNHPFSPSGETYGGGGCDLPLVLRLARRARKRGMDWLLDFHYSDFWTDPGKQTMPKAWCGLDQRGLEQAVYDYTRFVLSACGQAGVMPKMVQIGNELTNGLLWPHGKTPNWDAVALLVQAGVRAVRDTDPAILVMLHLDNGGKQELYRIWFDNFAGRGGDWDIIGLSYYPFWHGSMESLADNMHALAGRYGKDLVIAETSMGFTCESYASWEQLSERKGAAATCKVAENVDFPMTPEGQSEFTRSLLDVIHHVPQDKGLGFFWWEPGWIPVPGSGWSTKAGWEYVGESGPAGNEWANQALFDFDGNPLPALNVIRDWKKG